jgi:guanyl-specific ribonuclease Sa
MSAGLRLFSDPDDHNDSAQKELEKQSDADSPDLLESGAGVSSWPWEESLPTDNAESASDDPLSLLLFQPRNKNRRTPGEDAFVVNEVTNAALPEQKMASQLASEPCTTDESGASERHVERPPFKPNKGQSFLDALEQQGARDFPRRDGDRNTVGLGNRRSRIPRRKRRWPGSAATEATVEEGVTGKQLARRARRHRYPAPA